MTTIDDNECRQSATTEQTMVHAYPTALTAIAAAAFVCAGLLSASGPIGTTPAAAQAARSSAGAAVPAAQPSFIGLWIDDTGDGAVELKPCAGTTSGQVCGSIYWLRKETDDRGRPLRDTNNEEQADRRRPICGMPVIGNLKKQPNGTLSEGWTYDPRRGQKFDVEITQLGPDKLQVLGYKGFKFLSKTFIWTRGPADLPRCSPPA
jgi:uncharacterized protein (DUF2147 family)